MRRHIRTRQSPGHGLDSLHHPPTPSRKCSIRHGPYAGVSTRHATGVNVASTHAHGNQMGPIPTDHNTPGPSRLLRRQAAGHQRGAKPHIYLESERLAWPISKIWFRGQLLYKATPPNTGANGSAR